MVLIPYSLPLPHIPRKRYFLFGGYCLILLAIFENTLSINRLIQILSLVGVLAPNSNAVSAQACSGTSSFSGPASVCINSSIKFNFGSSVAIDSFRIVFGDGSSFVKKYVSSGDSTNHSYTTAGTFYLRMIRRFTAGCRDTIIDSITVVALPSTAFTIGNDSVCSGSSNSFNATATGLTYSWKINGSVVSSAKSFSQTFSTAGSYTVKLITTNATGCVDSATKTFTVFAMPTVAFTFSPDSSCANSIVTFSNSSSGTGLTHSWNFADSSTGNPLTSATTNPTHAYTKAVGNSFSSYSVKLICTSNAGCKDSATKTVRVKERPDGTVVDVNSTVSFTNCSLGSFLLQIDKSSTTSSTDSVYFIDWDNGRKDTITNASFSSDTNTYNNLGFFTLKVTVTGKNKCINTKTYSVFNGTNPSVGFANPGGTTNLCGPIQLKFPVTSTSSNPPGTTYIVSSNDGNTSLSYSHPPPDTVLWTFNRGSCGYTSQGSFANSFHLRIDATNPCGVSAGTVEPITVNQRPVAKLSSSADTICKNSTVTFTDNSLAGVFLPTASSCDSTKKRLWKMSPTANTSITSGSMGDSTKWYTSNNSAFWGTSTFTAQYTDTGAYTTKIIVANKGNTCGLDSAVKTIYVVDIPVAAFTPKPDSGCVTFTDTMINQSTGKGLTYVWIVSPTTGFSYTGSTSNTSTNPVFKFTSAGLFVVELAVTNPCTTVYIYDTIKVKTKPAVTLPAIANGCKPYSISPSATYNSNNSTISAYSWTFTGGSPATKNTQSAGTIVYSSAGTYTVVAKATNECGTDSATRSFTVFNPPTVNAGKSIDSICLNNGNFTLSGYSPTGGTWSGTAVSSGGVFNPSTSGVGLFTLKYTYTDANGCTDTATKKMKVFDIPVVKFSAVNKCLDSAIQFTDSSTAPSSSITSRKWYFGDGNTSTATNPSHTYTSAGTYTVKLVITNSFGCSDSLSKNIIVYPKPQVSFSVNDSIQCISGNSFVYTNLTSITLGSISIFKWTFGDTATSNSTSPTHSFADTGTYITKLIAISNNGCKDSVSKTMKVLNGPSVSFTINDTDQCLTGNSFSYNSTSTANGGTITNYAWDFGNGNTSTSASPAAQTYSSAGVYSVKLIITNSKGCKDSLSRNITIYAMPIPSFTFGATSFCAPYTSAVTNSSAASPFITAWKWSIQGNSSVTISNDTAKQPTFTFPDIQSGTDSNYTIKLKATSKDGCKDSTTVTITIKSRPKALYTFVNDSCGPIVFTIQNNSLNATGYNWSSNPSTSFSNTTIAQPIITLARNQTGSTINYIIKLVIANAGGCKDSLNDTVKVYADPNAKFTMSNIDSCGPLRVYLTNTTTPSAGTTYNWDFGNGVSSTIKDTSIIYYNTSGNDSGYSITLKAKSSLGCFDDSVRTVNIKPNAKAIYNATNTSGCAPFVIDTSVISTQLFTNANSTYKWYANGSLIGSAATFPGYTITNSNDSVLIKLKVTSLKGCKDDSIQMWFKTITNPQPNFVRSDTIGCNPLIVLFTNTSTPTGLAYQWQFGNSSNTSTQTDSLYYTFTNTGTSDTTWKVKLIGLAGAGCKDSIAKNIVVHPSSQPMFTVGTDFCVPASISPSNNTAASPAISSWKWNVNDGSSLYKTSTLANPTFTFNGNQSGIDSSFNIWLYSTTASACTDSIQKTFTIHSRPLAKYSNDTVCQRLTTTFTDSSTFSSASGNIYSWKFGDGDSSSVVNPTHIYPTGGTYINKLTITSTFGCIDTLSKPVVINPKPTPTFTYTSSVCAPVTLSPSNNTAAVPTVSTWNWNIIYSGAVVKSSIIKNPSFIFGDNQTGSDSNFNIRLIATTNKGCIDSTISALTVKTRPIAAFTSDTASCGPDTFIVSNSSQFAASYNWSIAPATGVFLSSSAATNPTFTFGNYIDSVIKTYTIKNIATTSGGCKDTIIKSYNLYPTPLAALALSRADTCGPVRIYISNNSSPYNGLNYNWNYGNGISATSRDTSLIYYNTSVNDSIYNISLTTTNIYNCLDTQSTYLTIRPDAKAYFTATDSVSCAPYNIPTSKISATHYGTANSQYKWFTNATQLGATQTGATLSFPGTSITNANDSILISLVAISKNGCKNDTQKLWFRTIANPTPNFVRSDTVGCHQFVINLADASTPTSGLVYEWTLGNGQTSTIQNPTNINYNNSGIVDSIYTVKLVVSAGSGCKDSISKTVTAKPLPNPNFGLSTDTICWPFAFTATNSSSLVPLIKSYLWRVIPDTSVVIANDSASTSTTINLPDNKTGAYKNYTVKQIAKSIFGCFDSISLPIVLPSRPIASFDVNPTNSCGPAVFNLQNNSLYALSYKWSTTHTNITISSTTATNPTVTVPENKGTADSIYTIKLIATGNNGCKDTITNTFTVHPRPRGAFVADSINSCGPVLVTFTNQSTSNTSMNYNWDLGDGNADTATNPTHTYNSSNTQDTVYTITLFVTSSFGCKDTVNRTINVKPGPTSQFSISDTLLCTHGGTATLNIQNLSFGNVDTFFWDFGDTTFLTTTVKNNFSHNYTNEGIYKLKLTAVNECRITIDSARLTVLEPPHITTTQSDTLTCNPNVKFTGFITNNLAGTHVKYKWLFGNGDSSNLLNPSTVNYGLNKTGKDSTYIVKFTAWNNCDTATIIDSVRIRTTPYAFVTPLKQVGCSPFKAVFVNTTLGIDSNLVTDYMVWDFGDGTPIDTVKNKLNRTHTYIVGSTDTFYVKLWAYNQCGVDSQTHQLIVYPNSIVPLTSILPANGQGCNPLTVTFTNNTTGANSFTWKFDSVNGTNTKNAQWTFTKAGIYNVEMNAANACSDTSIYIAILVTDPPIVSFSDSGKYCEPGTVYFTNKTINANSYSWNFGDGDTSIATSPNHLYDSGGIYKVILSARNIDSTGQTCVDTFSKYITIYNKPVPSLSASATNGCEALVVNFSALGSTHTNNYFWDFGNGNTSTNINPQQTYTTLGNDTTYKVRLVNNNVNGCSDSAFTTITVYAKPKAGISAIDTFACFPGTLSFNNISSSNAAAAVWDFGDGQTSNVFNSVNHTWAKPGIYKLKLKVTTVNGCVDSTSKLIKIGGNDTLKIVAIDTILCLGVKGTYQSPNVNPQKVEWDFGDGVTDTGRTIKHNWFTAGTYTMIMTMTGSDGCIDSATRQIVVNKLPLVDFSVNDSLQCVNTQQFNFTANASAAAGLTSFTWKWGDGKQNIIVASTTAANHSYTVSGTYIVRLLATTTQGCIDSAAHTIIVWPKPNMVYAINDTDQCVNSQFFSFTNSSSVSSGYNDYNWLFGDGQNSTATNPTYTYADTGVYKVTLYATTDNGCVDSLTKTVYVRPKPTLDFILSDTNMCLNGNTFKYTPTATIPYGTLSLFWDFGDGNTQNTGNNQSAVKHSYATAGTYNIKLKVNSSFGCTDSVTHTIIVWPKPSPIFTVNDSMQCVNYQNFIYTNNSTIFSGSMQYDWYFGDAQTSINNSSKNVSHTYANYGMYDIKLVAISDFGCKDSVTNSIIVAPKPTVDFAINTQSQCLNINSFSYINLTTIPGGNLFYAWDFGDGKTSTAQSPSHVYTSAGTYNVKLVVTTQLGCEDSITKQITVWPKPTVAFAINDTDQCLTGNSFIYTNNCSILSGTMTYDWYYGDGNSTINSGSGQQTHSYSVAGTYIISLIATSDMGCVDTLKRAVVVRAMPVALFAVNQDSQCVNNQAYDYFNQSTIDFGALKSFWDFGNGKTSVLKNPSTFYNTAGNYTVRLWVTSDYGCSDSTNHIYTVTPKPKSDFSLSDTAECVQLILKFTDQSSSDAVSWLWDFDDPLSGGVNNNSTLASPTHGYIQPGNYYPNLITFNQYRCSDTSKHHAVVYQDPTANFYINPTAACDTPITANCINISQNATAYIWELGNGKTSTLTSPTAIYINNGTYNVVLTAITTAGCMDSMTLPYIVAIQPKAIFKLKPHAGCEPLVVEFENVSTNNTFNFWNFNDGQGSIIASPTHIYDKAGTYMPTLIIKNGNCFDTANEDTIIVYPLPLAGFTWVDDGPPPSGTIKFTNQSVGAISYFWNFGDGTQSVDEHPTHRYQQPKDYIVTLIVNTNFGCYDTFVQTIHVELMKGLWVSNAMSPDGFKNDAAVFQPQGVGLQTYHVRVFTTWGELIWESTELEGTKPKESWDGTWKGKPCKQDVYVWKIDATFIDGSVWPGKLYPNGLYNTIGSLTLIR